MKIKFVLCALCLFYSFVSKAELIGQPAPTCLAKQESENQAINFSEYQGRVLLIDFWATWCPPCKQSMPFLNALRNEFKDQGFEIIAINVDEDRDEALSFLLLHPVEYLLAYDSTGDCPAKFEVQAMPSSYFIDKQGKVRDIHLGYRERDKESIRKRIVELLAE